MMSRNIPLPASLDISPAAAQAASHTLTQRERARRAASLSKTDSPFRTSIGHANPHANRYGDIIPYDRTLVHLSSEKYVNANWISELALSNEVKARKYIAAQAPLQNTLEEWWSLFLLPNGPRICVMLTGLTHPEGEIEIKHIEYLNWPDHGVPSTSLGLLDLVKLVEKLTAEEPERPLLVHCSAGVGRTGTFIAVSNILRYLPYLESTKEDVVMQVVENAREQRCLMVQTEAQLQFVRQCAKEAWLAWKGKQVD
ncbi:receptor-type tyrosine- phosphatase eta [Olea europaea subsp. europaea]|uniref:Receptor-type tyrosine- phosphatase eta n=1 Tax=Olea europaea subsp. europaea TaxID=158383 RepID=A0A8S0SDP7_OLEEU|nr:receptor-type tyrosine- phosphatase eta [Olea europaea subsp. europaea]